jgi:hypothetical protein
MTESRVGQSLVVNGKDMVHANETHLRWVHAAPTRQI